MSKLTFSNLEKLVPDMVAKGVYKEHFAFNYARQTLDCIFSLGDDSCELLVGVRVLNFGFLISLYRKANGAFIGEITEESYRRFCQALNLSFHADGFSTDTLLKLISSHVPTSSAGVPIYGLEKRNMLQYQGLRLLIKMSDMEVIGHAKFFI